MTRLQWVEPMPGETVARLCERAGSTWSPKEVAAYNRISESRVPQRPIKIAVTETYRGR